MHITDFTLKNFKIFNEIRLQNLGQINIFLGDNNSGKTSLLHGLLFSDDVQFLLFNLFNSLAWKYNIAYDKESIEQLRKSNYLESFTSRKSVNKNISFTYKEINSTKEKEISIQILRKTDLNPYEGKNLSQNTISIDQLLVEHVVKYTVSGEQPIFAPMDYTLIKSPQRPDILPYIPSNLIYSQGMITNYSEIDKLTSNRNTFMNNLRFMIPDIEDIRINRDDTRNSQINIYQKGMEFPIPLSLMGDGAIRTFRVLMKIQESKGKRLMIDEIDNGLHYSRQKDFWISILNAARENNVQLFITTHNVECLKNLVSAIRVLEIKEFYFNNTVCYSLFENKLLNKVDSIRYDYYGFETCINQEIELRG
jgi:AAA15 family ATPase/GTPase